MVKCYRGGEKMENPQMHAYTLPWSEYALDDLFSSSNIESREKEKKNLHSIKLLRVLFWKENVIVGVWMCGGKGMAIRCGNHETKNVCPYPYSLSLSFDCSSLFFSFLWKVYWIHRYNKKIKKREKLMRNSCRHIHQASFSDVYYVSVVMLLCKLLQTSETLFLNCMIPFAYTFENLKQQEKIS